MGPLLKMVGSKCGFDAFARDAGAVAPLEYAFLAGLIAFGIMAGLSAVATPINDFYLKLANAVVQQTDSAAAAQGAR